jgi:hypothetical protein
VNERGDRVDHDQHDGRQRVDAQRPVDLQIARDDPREQRNGGVVMHESDVDEDDPGQRGGDEQ